MPKELEAKLKRIADTRHYSQQREGRYVYGTLRKLGWTPKRERGRK